VLIDAFVKSLVARDSGDKRGLAVLNNPPGDALIRGKSQAFEAVFNRRVYVTDYGEIEFVLRRVAEEDGAAFRLQEIARLCGDVWEQLVKIDQRIEGPAQFKEEGKFIRAWFPVVDSTPNVPPTLGHAPLPTGNYSQLRGTVNA
jgi:hypothetical protein